MTSDLDIPEFLRRVARSVPKAASSSARVLGRPPRVELHLQDEIRAVGSGSRFVTVLKIGRKWVWLRYGYRQTRIRVRKDIFEKVRVKT